MKRTAIDLFCGAGGLSEGFSQAGFHVLAGNDIEVAAGKTFTATHDEAQFLSGPIQAISADEMMNAAGLAPGELDVLIGGPLARHTPYIITNGEFMTNGLICSESTFALLKECSLDG